jgi:hypothetical protein
MQENVVVDAVAMLLRRPLIIFYIAVIIGVVDRNLKP